MITESQPGRPIMTGHSAGSPETAPSVTILPEASPWINRRASDQAARAAHARQSSGRRRYVDPATSEREYSASELEFMNAMQDYKKRSGRLFPTWSEVLEVLQELGYSKEDPARLAC